MRRVYGLLRAICAALLIATLTIGQAAALAACPMRAAAPEPVAAGAPCHGENEAGPVRHAPRDGDQAGQHSVCLCALACHGVVLVSAGHGQAVTFAPVAVRPPGDPARPIAAPSPDPPVPRVGEV